MVTVSKETFTKICNAFSESVEVYRKIDELIEYSHRRREYYKKAIKPVMRILVNDIAGEETLNQIISQDDWGTEYLYDMVMLVMDEYFNNDTQTVAVKSETTKNGVRYVGFTDVFTPGVIYDWLRNLDIANKDTWVLPTGPVASGYEVVKHNINSVAFEEF